MMDHFDFEEIDIVMSGKDQNRLSNKQQNEYNFDDFGADLEQQKEYDAFTEISLVELNHLQELQSSLSNDNLFTDAPANSQTHSNPNLFEPSLNNHIGAADYLEHNQPMMQFPQHAPPPVQPQMQPNYANMYPQSLAPGYGVPPQLVSNQAKWSLQQPIARGVYRNAILNHMPNADRALQVIDQSLFPLPDVVRRALEIEISRQKDEETARILQDATKHKPSAMEDKSRPRKADIKPLKGSKNKRSANIRSINPDEWYKTIPQKPASWGSINPETGGKTFQYSAEGELTPGVTYTVEQILEYLGQHHLHTRFGTNGGEIDTHKSTLKLWIQKAPADSAHRYPTAVSSKCRFEDCPKDNNTITKGETRVCFDEIKSDDYEFTPNPFHNAGYVHLYCLEHFLDFPDLCKKLNVLPDTRQLPEGKNPMAINKDEASQARIVKDFVKKSKPWNQFDESGFRPATYYDYTLNCLIALEHLNSQSNGVQQVRKRREGNSLDVHLGNLHTYADNVKIMKEMRTTARDSVTAHGGASPSSSKRKRLISPLSDEDKEDVLDDDILQMEARPMKKTKRS